MEKRFVLFRLFDVLFRQSNNLQSQITLKIIQIPEQQIILTPQHCVVHACYYFFIKQHSYIMKSNHSPMLALSNINYLPDGHVHSKISFLKSIINEEQNPEIKYMKEKMLKLTYTVKNIGVHGEQIGISSKRVPLKTKQDFEPSQITSQKRKQVFIKKYLPQNSFFSQPLTVIKKQKTEQQQANHCTKQSLLLDPATVNRDGLSQTRYISSESKFSKKALNKTKFGKTFSTSSKLQTSKFKSTHQKNEEDFPDGFEKLKRSHSEQKLPQKRFENKKSFAKLLSECGNANKQEILIPIHYEQNPLFKKIKKLQEIFCLNTEQKYEKYRTTRQAIRASSQFAARYHPEGSATEMKSLRRTLFNKA